MTAKPITHYTDDSADYDDMFLCVACGIKVEDAEPHHGDAHDYADEGGWPYDAECAGCGTYVFPENVKEVEAEHRYYESLYRSGALKAMAGIVTEDDLDAYEPGDPKRISLERQLRG